MRGCDMSLNLRRKLPPPEPPIPEGKRKSLFEHIATFQTTSVGLLSSCSPRGTGAIYEPFGMKSVSKDITLFRGYSLNFTQGAWLMYCIQAGIHYETGRPQKYN